MKKTAFLLALCGTFLVSCVSSKKYSELEALQKSTNDLLNSATVKLNTCDEEKASALANVAALEEQISFLKANNQDLISNLGNLTTLSQKGAENLEKSLESLKEKDSRITNLRDAVTRKDSVTLALVTSLKGVLGNIADEDIEINVEKGVVYVSISDKLLFRSGSFSVNKAAKDVLGKVAKVINDKKMWLLLPIMIQNNFLILFCLALLTSCGPVPKNDISVAGTDQNTVIQKPIEVRY